MEKKQIVAALKRIGQLLYCAEDVTERFWKYPRDEALHYINNARQIASGMQQVLESKRGGKQT
ncbi:MAG: hypothetical protein IMZ71_04820 [Chloroflexi bacterium]|nr:hypothetical protein [Chloroflexota bacterium]